MLDNVFLVPFRSRLSKRSIETPLGVQNGSYSMLCDMFLPGRRTRVVFVVVVVGRDTSSTVSH